MEIKIDLKAKPFYLEDDQIEWIKNTIEGMSLNDKLGQLFLPSYAAEAWDKGMQVFDDIGLKPCGVLLRKNEAVNTRQIIKDLQDHYEIPLFITGDLERGASAMLKEGTMYGHNLALAATDDPEIAYRAGVMCAEESAAVGANWNFGPVTDIEMNPFNPVTNVRTFGEDVDKVITYATNIARGMRDGGMVPTAKHWPGDGVDGRDQHFVATYNSLSVEEWDATYGRVYKAMIDEGVETVMTAHIMQPAYTRYFNPDVKDEDMLPASLSYELNVKLLREKLGFNGVIITDASTMVGFLEVLPRHIAVPTSIAHGADIFLFTRDIEEDFQYMKDGVKNGILTEERVDEALVRILALKQKLRLPQKKAEGTLVPPIERLEIFKEPHRHEFAREVADKSITLVKDTQSLLPLDPKKQHRIYLIAIGDTPNYHTPEEGYVYKLQAELEKQGFYVKVFDNSMEASMEYGRGKIEDFKKNFDVVLYMANVATSGGDSAARISWPGKRIGLTAMIRDVPNIMVSIDNPYHLMDASRIPTYVNCYTSSDAVIEVLAEKLAGKSEFKGVSPVDAFVSKYFPNTDK